MVQCGVKLLLNVKNIVVVVLGKGGVGKSMMVVNFVLVLVVEGVLVGIFDVDIYGLLLLMMLGIYGQCFELFDNQLMNLLVGYGLQVNLIGFLIEEDNLMVWCGLMVMLVFEQLLCQINWCEFDYLIVDMLFGMGDIQFMFVQCVFVIGVVIVMMLQDIVLLDVKKGLKMFEKVGILIFGIVENMSIYICLNCGYEEYIFGVGGVEWMVQDYGVNVFGSFLFDIVICECVDSGMLMVVVELDGVFVCCYCDIVWGVVLVIVE